jgi:thiamine-monophosphate kinase
VNQIAMGSGGEFDRIRSIVAALGDSAGPIGGDTAPVPDGEGTLVVSTDTSVEHVHFEREWLTPREIGWRAAASALSDLAAAAARPVGLVVALSVPRDAARGDSTEVMHGIGDAARSVGASVLGGDLSESTEWNLAVTVLGRCVRPMSRVGARPEDGVWVTGTLGGARAALDAWQSGREPAAIARSAFAHPSPRISAALWLATHGATAMMDLSDGIGGDAQHLAAASKVQLRLTLNDLPIHPAVANEAGRGGITSPLFAADGGEDYELLVTLPREFDAAGAFERDHNLALTRIGDVCDGAGVIATLDGKVVALNGYRHRVK